MLPSALAGLGLGLSLIVAIGAQNLFLLRTAIRREHVVAIASVCAVSDAVLILAGVSGVGVVLEAVPWLTDAVRWAGAIFLVAYGLLAGRRAWRPAAAALAVDEPGGSSGGVAVATKTALAPALMTCLALTWLNPHVYLDTVFLVGSVANAHGDERWAFAAGAVAGSTVWFFSLAFGARLLGRWLATPRAWRILDAVIALVMIGLGISLVLPH